MLRLAMERCITVLRTDLQVREIGIGITRERRRREQLATPTSKSRNESLTKISTSRPLPNLNRLLHHSLLFRRLHLTNLNLPEPPQRPRQHASTLGRPERPPPRRQAARERGCRHVG
jgi:hypothetical protein